MFSGRQFLWDNIKWGIIDGGLLADAVWVSIQPSPPTVTLQPARTIPQTRNPLHSLLAFFPSIVLSKLSQAEYTITNTNIRITTTTLRNQFTVRLVLRSKRSVLLSTALFHLTSTLCFVPWIFIPPIAFFARTAPHLEAVGSFLFPEFDDVI